MRDVGSKAVAFQFILQLFRKSGAWRNISGPPETCPVAPAAAVREVGVGLSDPRRLSAIRGRGSVALAEGEAARLGLTS